VNGPPGILYHFTCRAWWHFIERDGITRGEVPISRTNVAQHPNLTANPQPNAQKWAGIDVGESVSNKIAVRISVKIPDDDDRIISWQDFANRNVVDRRWYRELDEAGGWEARNWWIYQGVVRPEWFVDFEFFDRGLLNSFDKRMLEIAEISSSYDDVMNRVATRKENGHVFVNPFTAKIEA
jgi:hypothetical protein